jgi:K+ transporter
MGALPGCHSRDRCHCHSLTGGHFRAFSLSQQAMQLSLLPRLEVRQTSAEEVGQVYVPEVNWLLAASS